MPAAHRFRAAVVVHESFAMVQEGVGCRPTAFGVACDLQSLRLVNRRETGRTRSATAFVAVAGHRESATSTWQRKVDMLYEPDTVWGRTVDGDSEIEKPTSGLSLTQRKLLRRLEHPRPFAAFAAQSRLPPPKLEHELMALAKLRLVAFQRPGSPRPRTAPTVDRAQPGTVPPPAAASSPLQPTAPAGSPPARDAAATAPPKSGTATARREDGVNKARQTISIATLLPLCFAAAALGIASVLLIVG